MNGTLKALTLATAIAMVPGGVVAAKDKVVIADMNWTGAIAIANVLKVVMGDLPRRRCRVCPR